VSSFWTSPHGRALPAPGVRTLVMGVLNVTPDSFSDGGKLPSVQAVVDHAGKLLAEGADVLDIGGESTRPEAKHVDAEIELMRVLPALEAFPSAPISIDTYKPEVAEVAVKAGADMVNDIWGCTYGVTAEERHHWKPANLHPSPMAQMVAKLKCPIILMHNRPDKNYADFWKDVVSDLSLNLMLAQWAGVAREQIWLDPGFGFAKDPVQNLEVLKNLSRIVALGFPVLLGTSRKSTIGNVLDNAPVEDRLDGTAATVVWGIQQGAAMVRLHEIAPMKKFIKMADAIKAGIEWRE